MNLLNDIITYVRRIIKSMGNAQVSDGLIIDYINRFYIMDVDARLQLFDLKKKYQFQTVPGVDKYNMPLYDLQSEPGVDGGTQTISFYPVYQGFMGPVYINGVQANFETQKNYYFNGYPNFISYNNVVATGNGGPGPYTFTVPVLSGNAPTNPPFQALLRGHVDIAGIIATGSNVDPPVGSTINTLIPTTSIDSQFWITSLDTNGNSVVVADSGQFLTNFPNNGLLMTPGNAPYGNTALPGGYSATLNTINYISGECSVVFPVSIPAGVNINVQCLYFQSGLPRTILYYNNVITLRSPPDRQYLVELEGYLSPAAFFNTSNSIPYAYMAEYIARGAARKMLSDVGDLDQFQFYEPLFREQEMLVWARSQRQFTSTRTQTIYSNGLAGSTGYGTFGQTSF